MRAVSVDRVALALAFAAAVSAAGASASCDEATPVACDNGPYPAGPYGTNEGEVLESQVGSGVREDGTRAALAPSRDAWNACGEPKVYVVRVQASFCGTCRTSAQTTLELPPALRERTRIVDVVVRDEDAEPAEDIAVAERWQAIQDVKTTVLLDPSMRFFVDKTRLPRVLVVDPKTMVIEASLSDPAPEELEHAIATIAARLRGEAPPAAKPVERVDGRFTRAQARMIREMAFSGSPPPDPTNLYADSPGAAILGREVFRDRLFSPTLDVSCERCHEIERAFTDGAVKATGGKGLSTRNTPTVLLAAWARWQLWDGRADTLWMQALLPIEDPTEFASSRLFVAHRIFDVVGYRDRYEGLFGPMPPLDDYIRFPSNGKPGDAAWNGMGQSDQQAVTQVFVNVGKSIAAFERTLRVSPNPIDRYVSGETTALSDEQKDGLRAFFETGCAQCHWGGRLTDDAFHVMRFPSGKDDFTPDNGRIEAAAKYDANDFRVDGRWSDAAQPRRRISSEPRELGSFKTPALRGVAVTAPYGHGGSVPSLTMAVELHRTLGMPANNRLTTGVTPPWLAPFDEARTAQLVAFMKALSFDR